MADPFLKMPRDDQREILNVAADKLGRPTHLLEKDVWVVWAIDAIFKSSVGDALVFKGGTSLSKAYNIIKRFSEDVDLTYDIRTLIPELGDMIDDGITISRADERRWSKLVRERLPLWVEDTAQPILKAALSEASLDVSVRAEGHKLFLDYAPMSMGSGYVAPTVMLEFGARSTGEPASLRDIICDASQTIEGVVFPIAQPRVMHAERTFWEKSTAVHVFCLQERFRGDRFSRHWHDLVRLSEAGIANIAIGDRKLANSVARHKTMFFAEKAADGIQIDYHAAVGGNLKLVPEGKAAADLGDDYRRMTEDGLLLGDAEPFEELMLKCADLAAVTNEAAH
jgi:hypothetical protein